jgi:hypothetical protein
MPRRIKIKGKYYFAGIVGDFMVDKRYRALGPALDLMKTVIKDYSKLGFECVSTLYRTKRQKKCASEPVFKKLGC